MVMRTSAINREIKPAEPAVKKEKPKRIIPKVRRKLRLKII